MLENPKPLGAAGAAGMDSNYGQGMGVLDTLNTLGGSAKAGQQAMDFARQLYPDTPEADPWEAALRFFLKMGQDSSVPGATAVGAAFGAAPAALDYLTAKKKEKSETDRARMTAAVQLAPNLKPKPGKVTSTTKVVSSEQLKVLFPGEEIAERWRGEWGCSRQRLIEATRY